MTNSWINLGLLPTVWLASLGVVSIDHLSPLNLGPISALSWLVFLAGIVYFMIRIAST